jgi:hypothetical protein
MNPDGSQSAIRNLQSAIQKMRTEAAVPVSASMLAWLGLAEWNALPDGERHDLGRELVNYLAAAGYSFGSPKVRRRGPDREQPVLELRDRRTRQTFALVPGGRFAPGYDAAELAAYTRIHQRLFGWAEDKPWTDVDCLEGKPEEYEYYDPPERTELIGHRPRCDLRLQAEQQIAPFLMAVLPLRCSTWGLGRVLPDVASRTEGCAPRVPRSHEPAFFAWPETRPLLEAFRWALPSSAEYEWALRGGTRGVFYWGDDVPAFVLKESRVEPSKEERRRAEESPGVAFDDVMLWGFDPERSRVWPYANRFGLAGMLAWKTWCARIEGKRVRFPLVVRGGAINWWGWQQCGEWKLLLNAAEGRASLRECGDYNVVRPVIRLVADD